MRAAIARAGLLAFALTLAACGSGGNSAGNGSATAKNEAPVAPAQTRLKAGQWQANSEIVSIAVPGMPPEVQRQAMAHKSSASNCLTEEEAARPPSDFFNRQDGRSSCRSENFSMTGGRMAATMVCTGGPGGNEMRMVMDGRYEPERYDITSTMTGSSPNGEMKIVAHVTAQRTGECTAPAAPAPVPAPKES